MLVISRKPGTYIRLSGGIMIEIGAVVGNRVTVSIDAPNSVLIIRSRPCKSCGKECFGSYMGYHDIPVCETNRLCHESLAKCDLRNHVEELD